MLILFSLARFFSSAGCLCTSSVVFRTAAVLPTAPTNLHTTFWQTRFQVHLRSLSVFHATLSLLCGQIFSVIAELQITGWSRGCSFQIAFLPPSPTRLVHLRAHIPCLLVPL
ncbi:hypothetical protein BaRGS_00015121, partial [Batillaria attramentaria]